MEKNSYERRAYESVDNGSPSWITSQKWTENKIQAVIRLTPHRSEWFGGILVEKYFLRLERRPSKERRPHHLIISNL